MSDLTQALHLNISAVEREIGISKDALRVWERRYGFPNPERDTFGERSYGPDQIEKLRLIRRLMDLGHRPGKIVAQPTRSLRDLAEQSTVTAAATAKPHQNQLVLSLLEIVKRHHAEELRAQLAQMLLRMSLVDFITDVIAPLTTAVGEAWARGDLALHEEHMYTEAAQRVLRNAIGKIPSVVCAPRILLTTVPQEPHGLGLLMAEVMFAIDGCSCVSLGVQTPVQEIARAAQTQHADVVALSFSTMMNPNLALESLRDLRSKLPADIEIWAGGACTVLHGRRAPQGVMVLSGLHEIHGAVTHWRLQH
jgi:DNA-binding transcriptional MerR regulator/methylmalonyl-CoA mutase cobalamin-binding subunit